ncbi:agmatinase [Fulvimarina sp. 2208YS6-2-32]|uniref:Agmatinase n=1 Tax=Fulvimarina uroteuthidis TaxID=3098149 RepID=A0ABU5HZ21_9HYPH|nr:agmatinase [Fulvimarina sp. 2208YS6-2-32]MDY8107813.1 agmatinase [Fulvimarina sp. 2208YS6-2-32]
MPKAPIDHAFTASGNRGAASDPTYAAALSFMRRRFTKDVAGTDVTIWGVPFDASVSNRPGARFGPQAMRRASAIFDNDPQYPFRRDLFDQLSVVDYGDCALDYRRPETAHAAIRAEASDLLEKTGFLLTLGGDHSVTYPLLQALGEWHAPLSLVQFDAHQDTWDHAGTDADGSPRVDHGSFVKAAAETGLIDPETSIQIGIRTHAPQTCGIEILYGYDVEEMSAKAIAERIHARTKGTNVYLTFDIDCLDPAFAPGTGTPVAGGPSSARMLAVLHHLKNLEFVGADIVEVSPPYDHADLTAIAGATVAMSMLGILAEKKAT